FATDPYMNYSYIGANLWVNGYKGTFTLTRNFFDDNVTVSDSSTRTGENIIFGNYIENNLSITANSANNTAVTYISDVQEDFVNGDVTITINSDVPFNVGGGTDFYVIGNLNIKSDFTGSPSLNYVRFDASKSSHVTQLGTAPIRIYNATI